MNKKAFLAFIILALLAGTTRLSAQLVKVSIGVNGGALATQMMTEPAPTNPAMFYISGYGGAFASVHIGKAVTLRGAANYARTMKVKSTLPLIEPITVSASVGTTSGFALSHSSKSAYVRPTRHLALVFVSGFLRGLRRVLAKGRSCFFAVKSPSSIHP